MEGCFAWRGTIEKLVSWLFLRALGDARSFFVRNRIFLVNERQVWREFQRNMI